MSGKTPIAVLISGRGSNLQCLIDACMGEDYPARIVAVISNRPDAYGLERAREAGIAAIAIDHKAFDSRMNFEAALDAALREAGAEFVCLAGFMRILTEGFVNAWEGRMINIHPSLLPKFKGVDTHARAIEAGESEHGCTVHWVTPGMDEGPVIAQARVPVLPGDTPETLAARVLVEEHRLYPEALKLALEKA
ncbi:phosphoribosylglycinamide formyltransferase 1 [Glycocaulis alkaliphilus]|uniref:Phosphoribosylglycinamide formyltransferase n=1 Tax=Glycocaulis alkaliphilus TaxID=1434191 RepID=A0A3T0E840_9PROT|nr:phosphoribosylglycinamide formyltransferase [Glycocaulis alkaliphilus]AZU03376.1 phosphoribosylglycinamide formyltransferase 1 [Glycocaulis alkaliphilus]GGB73113.1 phosphoribosylglycinamide formyltransferase [Glycocaulis alkaliphilus]